MHGMDYYLSSREKLPGNTLVQFRKEEHVMRHQAGIWYGLLSDMFIETTFMRYSHGPDGDLVGITLNPVKMKLLGLSMQSEG
jgi:hypothetical protein